MEYVTTLGRKYTFINLQAKSFIFVCSNTIDNIAKPAANRVWTRWIIFSPLFPLLENERCSAFAIVTGNVKIVLYIYLFKNIIQKWWAIIHLKSSLIDIFSNSIFTELNNFEVTKADVENSLIIRETSFTLVRFQSSTYHFSSFTYRLTGEKFSENKLISFL